MMRMFPTAETHGGHKAATLTAYRTILAATKNRPVLLGCQLHPMSSTTPQEDWAAALGKDKPNVSSERFTVDRTEKFGFKNVLDYQIVVNWMIAAHKSQGAFQKDAGQYDHEDFAIIDTGTTDAATKTANLFRSLRQPTASIKPAQ